MEHRMTGNLLVLLAAGERLFLETRYRTEFSYG
jgi:hypothetical protein